ncbi:MAG TPA: glycine--tRNA ligase [Candidatus Paceibacterota bacterium]|jgi:glycyl-tRNA synthetase
MTKDGGERMENIVSLCKRRGFVYRGSEIYGGLAGTWDYGPLGNELKYNIEQAWWRRFVSGREDMHGISSSIVMSEAVWQASGHLEGFTDPMVECEKCKRRFRADHIEKKGTCPECGGTLGKEHTFNLLFPVEMGSVVGGTTTAYLRGEIAQGMFMNFKNVVDSLHPKLPFGIAQIGKAFRNEINPREFLFRVREFDLAEFEYFISPDTWEQYFEYWREQMWEWLDELGISRDHVHELEVSEDDRAHYSRRTIDFEYDYPFGRKELYGLAYRTDHDLKHHMEKSGVDLSYTDGEGKKFIPHVIEPTFGIGRTVLAVLAEHYHEDELGGEKRVMLRLPKALAPVKVAVFPLLKNKPELIKKAREVYELVKKKIPATMWDDNGNIGKRYRRQDEIGTPACITIDFETLEGDTKDTVTVRDRDSGEQKRVAIVELGDVL